MKIIEIAPRATPSRAAKASTRPGLTTFLNALTIDSTKAPRAPKVATAPTVPMAESAVDSLISGSITQVANAVTTTTPRVMAVFWTTESMVMGALGACGAGAYAVPWGSPGFPTPHCEGSEP